MAIKFQVTFDCAAPESLARFWSEALAYELESPPDGYATWQEFLDAIGVPEDEWDDGSSIVDPAGRGARIYFQRVPEGKVAKNRLHLDLDVGGGRKTPLDQRTKAVNEAAARVAKLGATKLYEQEEGDSYAVTMQDPEGNEFCLH
ncbi:MAG: VOC family protein [Actinomycetota bacterium]